jgi:hypothetical protein
MRKLLVSFAVATATLAAVPAAAQYHRPPAANWQPGPSRQAVGQLLDRLGQVENRIRVSNRRGIISQREATGLSRQALRIRSQLRHNGRNGLTGREFASLRVEVNQLEQRLHFERRDRDGRRG